ncbi:hypothetical protein BC629DRAFT_1567489 [Irpex lacteus]|nr:hypothetical protein BC629DRAFT_1567489 [Irpex lacteus]
MVGVSYSVMPFRALWTKEAYVQQRRTAPTAKFELHAVRWFYQIKEGIEANGGVCLQSFAGIEANLSEREQDLLVKMERLIVSELRQERAGISDAVSALRDRDIEPFLQPLHEPEAWDPYYYPGDPVVSPDSDDEDWADDEDLASPDAEILDRTDELPSGEWTKFVSIPLPRTDEFERLLRKDRALLRLPAHGIEGLFDRVKNWRKQWEEGRAYCLKHCGEGRRLVVVVAGMYDEEGLRAWAHQLYRNSLG